MMFKMNDNDLVIAASALDGMVEIRLQCYLIQPGCAIVDFQDATNGFPTGAWREGGPRMKCDDYLGSRDSIVRLIIKLFDKNCDTRKQFQAALLNTLYPMGGDYDGLDGREINFALATASARILTIACVKAACVWKESNE